MHRAAFASVRAQGISDAKCLRVGRGILGKLLLTFFPGCIIQYVFLTVLGIESKGLISQVMAGKLSTLPSAKNSEPFGRPDGERMKAVDRVFAGGQANLNQIGASLE